MFQEPGLEAAHAILVHIPLARASLGSQGAGMCSLALHAGGKGKFAGSIELDLPRPHTGL